jgi:hypothetical protein
MPRTPRLEKLTFLLLKEGASLAEALRGDRDLSAHVVPPLTTSHETLFVNAPPPHRPNWQNYLNQHVRGRLGDLTRPVQAPCSLSRRGIGCSQ